MVQNIRLPDGVTMEMLDEYARQKENARRRADYARHPERIERQRTNTYRNFLNRKGFLVIPMPPTGQWDEPTRARLLSEMKSAMLDQGAFANG